MYITLWEAASAFLMFTTHGHRQRGLKEQLVWLLMYKLAAEKSRKRSPKSITSTIQRPFKQKWKLRTIPALCIQTLNISFFLTVYSIKYWWLHPQKSQNVTPTGSTLECQLTYVLNYIRTAKKHNDNMLNGAPSIYVRCIEQSQPLPQLVTTVCFEPK